MREKYAHPYQRAVLLHCDQLLAGLIKILLNVPAVFQTVVKQGEQFENLARLWLGPKLLVLLFDPRDVELILSSQVYIDKSYEYKFFKPWLGEGLLISTGNERSY